MQVLGCRAFLFECGEPQQESEQNGVCSFEVVPFGHAAQFKEPSPAPRFPREVDCPPALLEESGRCLKDTENIFLIRRIDLVVNGFRRDHEELTASPGEHAERPLHPAGAPEEINQLASAVAVRGDIAYQPAPVGIKEQRQFTAFFHMERR